MSTVTLGTSLAGISCNGGVGGGSGPPVAPTLRLLVPGDVTLAAGGGDKACSRPFPGSGEGHTWCAFFRAAAEDRARTELWVLDVTAAMTGEPVRCDGSSTACLRMTDRLFTEVRIESLSHPEAHRFEGNTLFFLGEAHPASKDLDRFEGFVWAWRPGWSRPRAITTDRGVLCHGSDAAPVAVCVDGVDDRDQKFDLRAGRIVDSGESLLPVAERIDPERDGNLVWSTFFHPRGDLLAVSSWRDGERAQALRVIRFEEIGSKAPTTIIEDGWGWVPSSDGSAVYFLRDRSVNDDGTLWSADFPTGANPTKIAAGVFEYRSLGRDAIAFVTDVVGLEGVLNIVRDRKRPDGRLTLAKDAHAWYPLGEGRFSYVLQVDAVGPGTRGLIVDNQRGVSCSLGSTPEVTVFGATLLPNLGVVSWIEPDPADDQRKVRFIGRPEDCRGTRPLGSDIEIVEPSGPRGLITGTLRDQAGRTLTFQHVPILADDPVSRMAELILGDVEPENVVRSGGAVDTLLLGTAKMAAQGEGLFGFGPLDPGTK